ncbi:MAG: Hpt domain-containing protein, partial [Nitrospirota bacterium]|nr:Hpt domain-containing protein [Nitrospirota bacterium]
LIVDFRDNHAGMAQEIEQAVAKKDTETALSLVHALKGITANISAVDLSEATKALETAIKDDKAELIPSMITRLGEDMADIVESAALIETAQGRARTETVVSPMERNRLRRLAVALTTSLRQNDMQSLDLAGQIVAAVADIPGRDLVLTLQKEVNRLDFRRAEKTLEQLVKSLNLP